MTSKPDLSQLYDVVIVGGGPAGLTCALFLARARRRVLVIDAGKPRNYASHGVHGFLGQHGILPRDLLSRGRDEALEAGAEFCFEAASQLGTADDHFTVAAPSGVARGRRLVLAYGVRDVLPDLPEFEQYYGKSIYHCYDCDGYEVSDQRVGVIGWTKRVVGMTLALKQWTDSLIVLPHGNELELEPEHRERLQRVGVKFRAGRIERLVGTDGKLEAVEFAGGERLELDAMFFSIGLERTCGLAEQLDCQCAELSPYLEVSAKKETSVKGVYAIGDLIAGSQLAITAAADGAMAAIVINKSLLPPELTL